jgi:hypothetical protein
MWTKKHDDFCLENKIKYSSQLLWRWLMTEGQPGERIEIDLQSEFNTWVKKHRPEGGFTYPTLKSALNQLEEVGIVVVERTYTWRIHAIVFRALKWLKKSDPESKPICENSTPIPQFVSDQIEQQQQEKELREEVKSWGINYRDRDWKKIIKHGIENVKAGLQHLLISATTTEITKPAGWLRSCIQNQWWMDSNNSLSLSMSQLAYSQ